jgi:hypothetical protein
LRAAVPLNQNFFLTGYSIKSLTVILVCEYIKDVDFVRPAYSNEFLNPKILPKSIKPIDNLSSKLDAKTN